MRIILSPVRSDAELSITKRGETLVVNGISLDFSQMPDGGSLPATAVGCVWLSSNVERVDGDLVLTLLLPYPADAPESARFPTDIISPKDGQIRLPTGAGEPAELVAPGIIDWSQVVTADAKAQAAAAQLLAQIQADTAGRRAGADLAIAPLQDAVDLDEATHDEAALLKEWKRYRVALNRLPDQPGYPAEIDWPAPPA
jgi:hypothetical protein